MSLIIRKYCLLIIFALAAALLTSSQAASSAPKFQVGVFLPTRDPGAISDFEAKVGSHQDIIMYFQAWADAAGPIEFDAAEAQGIIAHGSIPMITWEPWRWGGTADQPLFSLKNIADGRHDSYIRRYARGVKAVGNVIYIRIMHEMNGDWYPWAGSANGNNPQDFVPAWRHIVSIFRTEGAANVRWVWAPNNATQTDWTAKSFKQYWPGDNYVDFAGIDGYNFGATADWSSWVTFPQVFDAAYKEIGNITTKPILIAETASTEIGGHKADWIKQAFDKLTTGYPRVVGLIWFNENKETDWRIESSQASLSAYRSAMARISILQADVSPPKIAISAPSRVYARANNIRSFRVRWSASDPSPSSGIASYKVQVRFGRKGAWTTWRRAARSARASFVGTGGQAYYFRARATDKAGHRSSWSAVKKTLVRRQII